MILEKVKNYIEENNISKSTIADKMGISEKKLNKILNSPDDKVNCLIYKKLVVALGVSANKFFN